MSVITTRIGSFFYSAGIDTRFLVTDCASCGVVFAIAENLYDRRRADKGTFYCPNGHTMTFGESDADRERKRADLLERRLANRNEDIRSAYADLTITKRRLAASKGQLTKVKKRAVAGLCPCCSRSFVDVRRHMANKHPGDALSGLGDGKP